MTQQQRSDEGVADTRLLRDGLLEALPDGVVIVADDGRIVAVNEQLCALAGHAHDALVGAPIEMLVPARFRAEHVALRSDYFAVEGEPRAMSARSDIVLVRADGRELPVDVALATVGQAGDRLVVATVRDASARRTAELAREREYEFLAAMNDVTTTLFSRGEVDETLRSVAVHARRLLAADVAWITVADLETEGLRFVVVDGHAAERLEGSIIPLSSMAGTVMREHEPILVSDASSDPRVHRPVNWPSDLGPALYMPLHARGETLGSLAIANRHGGSLFRPPDIARTKAFAAQATIALLDARRQVQARQLEVLQDRERLAAAVRDTVINRISTAALSLHGLVTVQSDDATATRLWDIITELDAAITAVREAVLPRTHERPAAQSQRDAAEPE